MAIPNSKEFAFTRRYNESANNSPNDYGYYDEDEKQRARNMRR